jgi:pyruvate/2-oxoglutarate dehydrogenase complex dihydrolipoamide acyltransferase (E2) component
MLAFTVSSDEMVIIAAVMGAMITAITVLFGMVVKLYERLSHTSSDANTWEKIATENTSLLERAGNKLRKLRGQPILPPVTEVIPEKDSPETEAQVTAAKIATVRARQAASVLGLELHKEDGDSSGPSDRVT